MNGTELMDQAFYNESLTVPKSKPLQGYVEERKAYEFVKRIMDILVAIVGCLLLIPITVILKIAFLCSCDTAPIFFKQGRVGKDGKVINFYKFRSMIPNADDVLMKLLEEDEEIRLEYKRYKKLKNDPRITKVGAFIRKTSIDEFPQFINILKGEMSIVGPRPYIVREIDDMGTAYRTIIKMKPGLTGYWQVNGRSGTDFAARLAMDEYYYSHRDLRLDTEIFFQTFSRVMKRDGAK